MKPAKGLYPFAAWLIRFSMLLMSYVFFKTTIEAFDFSSVGFYLAAVFTLFSVLLFIGGFLAKPAMTVISAFFLFGLSVYFFIDDFSSEPGPSMVLFMLSASAMLLLFSSGNKK